jgi:hypothetical protein
MRTEPLLAPVRSSCFRSKGLVITRGERRQRGCAKPALSVFPRLGRHLPWPTRGCVALSFLFTSATLSSLLKSMPEALNSCKVALKAAVSVSSSSGLKKGAYCWKGTVDTLTLGQVVVLTGGTPMMTRTLAVSPGRRLRAVQHRGACGAQIHEQTTSSTRKSALSQRRDGG